MLTYEPYTNNRLAIRGDRKHHKALNSIGARWNSKMIGGAGWVISQFREKHLQKVIEDLAQTEKLGNIAKNCRSKKEQRKYHREGSESDSDNVESDIDPEIQALIASKLEELDNENRCEDVIIDAQDEISSNPEKEISSDGEFEENTTEVVKSKDEIEEDIDEESGNDESDNNESDNEDEGDLELSLLREQDQEGQSLDESSGDEGKGLLQRQLSPELVEVTYKKASRRESTRKKEKLLEEKRAMKADIIRRGREKEERRAMKKEREQKLEITRQQEERRAKRREQKQRERGTSRNGRYSTRRDQSSPNILDYYENFSKHPDVFQKFHTSSPVVYSSSPSGSESSDDFPSPDTPHSKLDQKKLLKKMRDLQRRLTEKEIENKKLRARQRGKRN